MLNEININNILFLDIETVPQYSKFDEVPERFQKLWVAKKANKHRDENTTIEESYEAAGLYPEFGKVAVITVGFHRNLPDGTEELRLASFANHDETVILTQFAKLLNSSFNSAKMHKLCAHNGKGFDFPFLAKRMIIHGIKLPALLDTADLKPWESPYLDTMTYWKFGNFRGAESLDLLCACFDVPTPKGDISGADVGSVYWQDNDLDRIALYCEKDVEALVHVARKLGSKSKLSDEQIIVVTRQS